MSELHVIRCDPKAKLPKKATRGSAGLDIYSLSTVRIAPKANAVIPTGIKLRIPKGVYVRIAPRSGLACNFKIDVMGGVIDPDYEGEIKVILINHSSQDFEVAAGDRIAQIILEKFQDVCAVVEKDEYLYPSSDEDGRDGEDHRRGDDRRRGAHGFGSTGLTG